MAVVVSQGRSAELARTAIDVPQRGLTPELTNPHPFSSQLPALLQEDEFCVRLTEAFDDMSAPIHNTLDCLPAYFDAQLAPEDFLHWLGSWVGLDIDENWSLERRRELIRGVVGLYKMRGTSLGLAEHVRLYAGVTPEIEENGGCLWSQTANTPLPGAPDAFVNIRLRVPDPTAINRRTVEGIVDSSRPAHLVFSVEIQTATGTVVAGPETDDSGGAADAPGAVDLPGSERIDLAPPGPESQEDAEDGPAASEPDGKESAE